MKKINPLLILLALIFFVKTSVAKADGWMLIVAVPVLSLDIKNKTGTTQLSSSSSSGFLLGGRYIKQVAEPLQLHFGVEYEYNSYVTEHRNQSSGGLIGQFESKQSFLNFPILGYWQPIETFPLNLIAGLTGALKLSESSTVVSCPGICETSNNLKSFIPYYSLGLNYNFQVVGLTYIWSQEIGRNYESTVAEVDLSRSQFLVSFFW